MNNPINQKKIIKSSIAREEGAWRVTYPAVIILSKYLKNSKNHLHLNAIIMTFNITF